MSEKTGDAISFDFPVLLHNMLKRIAEHRVYMVVAEHIVNDFALLFTAYIAITGPSGSGKSTLMNILGLLDTCDSGTYMFSGLDTKTLADNVRRWTRQE